MDISNVTAKSLGLSRKSATGAAATDTTYAYGGGTITISAGIENGAAGNVNVNIRAYYSNEQVEFNQYEGGTEINIRLIDPYYGKTYTAEDIERLLHSSNSDPNKPSNLDLTKFEVAFSDDLDPADLWVEYLSLRGGSGVPGYIGNEGIADGTGDANTEYALNVCYRDSASNAITVIDKAIEKIASERSKLGSYQNRLEYTINNLKTSGENLQAAESRIRDQDMSAEMMKFTKSNILKQGAYFIMTQSNISQEQVLQLLR